MLLDGVKILLAEDNYTNRLVAMQMLESIGAEVAVAADGAEALEQLAVEHFDILLVDIEMPRVSGIEVIRRLQAGAPQPKGLTVVALTAYASDVHKVEITDVGADGVITKPIVSIDRLGTDLRRMMEASAVRRGETQGADIDREIYRGLADAVGPAAMNELLGKVDADIREAYDRMKLAISGNDMLELRAATHILIAVAGAVGAVGLQGLAERLNRAAHDTDQGAIATLGDAATAEAERVLSFIAAERKS